MKELNMEIQEEEVIHIWNEPPVVEESVFVASPRRVFVLRNHFRPGTNELEVLYNGIKALKDYEYEETNSNTVTFLFDLNEPDTVTFRISRNG